MRNVALLLAVSACAPSLDYAIDPSFSDEDRGNIEVAARALNGITKESHHITTDVDDASDFVARRDAGAGVIGRCTGEGSLIRLDPDLHGLDLFQVAMHEFGHAVGMRHVRYGVMNIHANQIMFSDEDLDECRRAGACP